jgi:plastocyanin
MDQKRDRRIAMLLKTSLRFVFLIVGSICCGYAQAKENFVIVGGNAGLVFSPDTLDIVAGDTVTFLNFGGVHNVVANDGSFRCAEGCDNDGHGGSGAPTGQLWSVTISFSHPGVVGYFCETHGSPNDGMFGTITVAAAAPTVLSPAPSIDGWWRSILSFGLIIAALAQLRRAR